MNQYSVEISLGSERPTLMSQSLTMNALVTVKRSLNMRVNGLQVLTNYYLHVEPNHKKPMCIIQCDNRDTYVPIVSPGL